MGTRLFFSRTMYCRANNVSIIAALVAGVPIPASFMLAFNSVSSSSLPAFSIAANSELSVCSGLGLVCFSNKSTPESGNMLPSWSSGSMAFSPSSAISGSLNIPRQPGIFITDPLTVKSVSSAESRTEVTSFTHLPEKASSIRPATSS